MGYAPNNCVMVIVGDVKTDDADKVWRKQYLEPIPRQEPPPPVRTVEPPQTGERRVTVVRRRNFRSSSSAITFRTRPRGSFRLWKCSGDTDAWQKLAAV